MAVFSNLQDSESDIADYVSQQTLGFPMIKDWDQRIARHFSVQRTSEVVLVDGEGNVHYQGRIDDQYAPGIQRSQPTTNDLSVAIDQLLSGEEVAQGKTESQGCLISYRKGVDLQSSVTFCRSIAPILIQHCVECHRPGEIGPFSMNDYEEVRGWAEMMVETVEQGRMPPWHAAAGNEPLKNERHFPRQSLDLLKQWVASGTPYGDPAEMPAWPQFGDHGWRMPTVPEKIIAMAEQPYAIAAKGTVDYQYFVVDPGFEEDVWISSAEIIPGNPAVVHHAIVFIRPPDGTPMSGIGWLTAYVPG
ncbi:MAG: alkyl hydroperoxide reductase, partial [bacterium]